MEKAEKEAVETEKSIAMRNDYILQFLQRNKIIYTSISYDTRNFRRGKCCFLIQIII